MNPSLTCSNTFSASAISQIENHMNNHVPNDGTPDGCWCERMWFIRDLPWWWKFSWRYWGPFAPAEVPEVPKPKEPLPIDPIDPIDPRIPRPIPPIPERSSEAGGDACRHRYSVCADYRLPLPELGQARCCAQHGR